MGEYNKVMFYISNRIQLNQDLGNIDFNALIATMETIKSSCTGPTLVS